MSELNGLLSGASAFGLLLLILWVIKLKKTLKEELVDPEIKILKEELDAIKKEIATLKKSDADLSFKLDKKLDSVKQALSETNQSIAKMQGSLDLLIQKYAK